MREVFKSTIDPLKVNTVSVEDLKNKIWKKEAKRLEKTAGRSKRKIAKEKASIGFSEFLVLD